ncbi:SxtJ family membrane protein [Lacisediminimonas profundi]|uniref:SxtJ family membrane protein n=1 Tax=Lacisediminimonas profundi TaxID=2603856 RepID=UPI00124B72D0|nr:SxtJ family membrane protein [Lacisediminimonas profundi]
MLDSPTSEEPVVGSSDRSFGLVFASVFLIIALLPLFSGHAPRLPAVAVALAFGVAAFLFPSLLAPLNRAWMRLGMMLHKLTSPIVLGLIFFLVITPAGLIRRVLTGDPLRLKANRKAQTYWVDRNPPGPRPDSLDNQF